MEKKRRLPVLQTPSDEEEAPARPPWQWVVFAALAIVVVWLPLLFLTAWAARGLGGPEPSLALTVLAPAAALALAATAGGFLVGRWGAPGIGVREAALGGLAAAVGAAVMALGAPQALWGAPVVAGVAVAFAVVGARLGLRVRRRRA